MNKYQKLMNNSFIFMIGNFGSKFISFLMVPLYTNLLTTAEYGTIDLITTTISLLVPLISLEFGQAIIRFSVDSGNKVKENIIFSLFIIFGLIISLIVVLFYPLLVSGGILEGYVGYLLIYLVLSIFNNFYSQFARGIGKVKEFAFNGIFMTVITVTSNILFLVVLDFKVEGYLLSIILANLFSNIYFFIITNSFERLKGMKVDKQLFLEMIFYSFPLIPNGTMLWLINGSTRYFILFFIDASANGVFAIANKIPQIIAMVTNIFSQAWQLSSFEESESNDKGQFYGEILEIYSTILFVISSGLIIILKEFMKYFVEDSFYISWQLVPILVLGVVYQSLSSFLGTVYTSMKLTRGVFTTSIAGAVISVISSVVFLPIFGVNGSGLSVLFSFMVMFFVRLIDTKKYIEIIFNIKSFVICNIIYIIQVIILFLVSDTLLIFLEVVMFIILCLVRKTTIEKIFLFVRNSFTKKYSK